MTFARLPTAYWQQWLHDLDADRAEGLPRAAPGDGRRRGPGRRRAGALAIRGRWGTCRWTICMARPRPRSQRCATRTGPEGRRAGDGTDRPTPLRRATW